MLKKSSEGNWEITDLQMSEESCSVTWNGKTELLDTAIFYHITSANNYNFVFYTKPLSRTVFLTKHYESIISYTNSTQFICVFKRVQAIEITGLSCICFT
jgi:hypothetical protein